MMALFTLLGAVRLRGPAARFASVAVLCVLAPPAHALPQEAQAPRGHAAEGAVEAPSVAAIFREVPLDLYRFISVDTGMVLTAGAGLAAVAHEWDDDLVSELETNVKFNNALEPGSKYGAFSIVLGSSFAVYGVGRLSGHPHLAVVGGDLVRGQIVSQLWVQLLKHIVQRERPDQSNNVSFPSGHAAGGFAVAGVLAHHYGWKAAIPAYAGAAYIATARVHDNKHYLSDVIFGAAMGFAANRTVVLGKGRYGMTVSPMIGRQRAGVVVDLRPR
jgi:membrane-associated phospholipid phosphatase